MAETKTAEEKEVIEERFVDRLKKEGRKGHCEKKVFLI